MQQIVNFSVFPEVRVTNYPPITGYKLNPMPCFWDLIQMSFPDALQYLILNKTKIVALTSFRESIPPLRENIGYKQIAIDIDDIVSKTSQLVYEYQKANGVLPTTIIMGCKQYSGIEKLNFAINYNYKANLRIGNDRSPERSYRGMKVVIINTIDGIVLLGDKELKCN